MTGGCINVANSLGWRFAWMDKFDQFDKDKWDAASMHYSMHVGCNLDPREWSCEVLSTEM